jgi:Fe-S-cluster-containing hydrogenase component 2
VIIDNHCVGCGKCSENCPYGNISMEPVLRMDPITEAISQGRKAMVCDLDNCLGEVEDPSCVYACPHNAAKRVSGKDLYADVFGKT